MGKQTILKQTPKTLADPDLFENLIPILARNNLCLFFYGSTSKVLNLIYKRIKTNHRNLEVKFLSPPFRKLTLKEDLEIINIQIIKRYCTKIFAFFSR